MEVINGREERQHDQESSEWLKHQGDWLEKTRGNLMVAASVIASMSFQVMVNPPGGVWQGDATDACSSQKKNKTCYDWKVGTSVLQNNSAMGFSYHGMVISSTVSFSASMSLILLVISGLPLRNRLTMAILILFMMVAVICMSAAFYFAVNLVQSNDTIIFTVLSVYVGFWIVFLVFVLLSQILRLLGKLVCLLCCCCRRRPRLTRGLLPSSPSPAQP